MPRPTGLRAPDEVVPKLGVKAGIPALRIGDVAIYDKPIEHLAGHLDRLDLDLPFRVGAARFGLVLCFALEGIDVDLLARELVRVTNDLGRIWVVTWKKDFIRGGAPLWEVVQERILPTGWVDNKILSFGDQCYGTQYVLRKERR
ncbi:MAG: hypothetical protein HYX56_05240 [Chloroflexi bacterium]|nr:hypothetical protein [Chloroflexota bacterium]